MKIQTNEAIDFFKSSILNVLPVKAIIAGGALRDFFLYRSLKPETDIDLYFESQIDFNSTDRFFRRNFNSIYSSEISKCYLYENRRIDLINVRFDSIEKLIETFDFTVCGCALDNMMLVNHKRFFDDLENMKLVLNEKANINLKILARLQKYVKKGFTANNETLYAIMMHINKMKINKKNLKLNNYDVTKTANVVIERPPEVDAAVEMVAPVQQQNRIGLQRLERAAQRERRRPAIVGIDQVIKQRIFGQPRIVDDEQLIINENPVGEPGIIHEFRVADDENVEIGARNVDVFDNNVAQNNFVEDQEDNIEGPF